MKAICVITARSGSKGLPGKNIKKLGKLPLIAWTIKAISASKNIEKIIFSTDSEEYFEIGKSINSSILWHNRESELAEDVPSELVLSDVLEKMDKEFQGIDLIVLIQPTTPFLTSNDIDECIKKMIKNSECNSCISVKSVSEYPEWMLITDENDFGKSDKLSGDKGIRQNLQERWISNGGIYVVKKEFLEKEKKIIDEKKILIHKMSKISSLDIDDDDDFKICQALVETNTIKPED